MADLTYAQYLEALRLAGNDPAKITRDIQAKASGSSAQPRAQARKEPVAQSGGVQARPNPIACVGSWSQISEWLEPLVRVWPRPDMTGVGLDSSTEARFILERLEPWRFTGEILAWAHEPLELRVGVGTPSESRYKPDFVVLLPDGRLVCREVKGGFERPKDTARMKAVCIGMPDLALEVWTWKKGWSFRTLGGPSCVGK